MRVQQQFDVANGFWVSPALNNIVVMLGVVFFLSFLLAIFTGKVIMEFPQSDAAPIQTLHQPLPIPPHPPYGVIATASAQTPQTERRETIDTKQIVYCYYCGAPMPTDAGFCRTCGKSQGSEK